MHLFNAIATVGCFILGGWHLAVGSFRINYAQASMGLGFIILAGMK